MLTQTFCPPFFLLHYGDDTPCISVNLDSHLLPFLLDTDAAVSVLPKAKLVPLLTKPLSSYVIAETEEDRRITAFGGPPSLCSRSLTLPHFCLNA